MPKNICLIGGIYPPDAGGPSKFLRDFEHFLLDLGINVSILVLTNSNSTIEKTVQLNKIKITRDSFLGTRILRFIRQIRCLQSQNDRFLVAGAFLEVLLSNLTKASRVVMKIPGDIVWERARNLGKTNSDIFEFQTEKLPLRLLIMRKLYTRALKSADRIIVPSEGLKKLTTIWGVNQSRVLVVYNSVDLHKYSSIEENSNIFDVLTVCRLTAWKGVDELIKAVAFLNLRLAVIGDGPERNNLEILARSLGANVTFFGELKPEQVNSYYKSARRFVLNSSYEGLPHVLLEARASKLLCLAREGTGSSEVISHLVDGVLYGKEYGLNLIEALQLSFSSAIIESDFVNRAYEDVRRRFNRDVNFEKILKVLTDD